MKRRTLLRGALGLLAGAGLAGCTGAGGEVPVTAEPPPEGLPTETDGPGGAAPGSTPASGSGVTIVDFGGREDADGMLVANVTVRNRSDTPQVRLVRATVTINDLQTAGERFVRLAPGEERTVRVPVDVSFEAWNASGSLTPQVVRRTPATPLPTDRETPTEADTSGESSPTPTPGDDAGTETGTDSGTPTDSTTTDSGTSTDSATASDSTTAGE